MSVCITLTVPLDVQPTQQVIAERSWGLSRAVLFLSITVVPRAMCFSVPVLVCCVLRDGCRPVIAWREETACSFGWGVSFITMFGAAGIRLSIIETHHKHTRKVTPMPTPVATSVKAVPHKIHLNCVSRHAT